MLKRGRRIAHNPLIATPAVATLRDALPPREMIG
jgi:hypothetical protein